LASLAGLLFHMVSLLHVLFERFAERDTGSPSPLDMLLYTLFFPTLLVGPIDRLPHFLGELRNESITFHWPKMSEGATRILIGAIKKYVLADLLLAHFVLAGLTGCSRIPFSWLQLMRRPSISCSTFPDLLILPSAWVCSWDIHCLKT
jgi:D-alanyl-lipoteichoic acid acyltransferase DltB (MBOAT superfamily)